MTALESDTGLEIIEHLDFNFSIPCDSYVVGALGETSPYCFGGMYKGEALPAEWKVVRTKHCSGQLITHFYCNTCLELRKQFGVKCPICLERNLPFNERLVLLERI